MPDPDPLFTDRDWQTLLVIAIVAPIAGLARKLYGTEPLTRRAVIASMLISALAALMTYPVLLHYLGGTAPGIISVGFAAWAGIFADLILRALERKFRDDQLPGPPGADPPNKP